MNPQDAAGQMELLRRRAFGEGSCVGIGADQANSLSPSNPISAGGPEAMTNPPAMQGGAAGAPSAGTVQGMKQQKGEAQTLVDAMIYRLKKLTERGE
jgi:hypothetical protein